MENRKTEVPRRAEAGQQLGVESIVLSSTLLLQWNNVRKGEVGKFITKMVQNFYNEIEILRRSDRNKLYWTPPSET